MMAHDRHRRASCVVSSSLIRLALLILLVLADAKTKKARSPKKGMGEDSLERPGGLGRSIKCVGAGRGSSLSGDVLDYTGVVDVGNKHLASGAVQNAIGCFEVRSLYRDFVLVFACHGFLVQVGSCVPDAKELKFGLVFCIHNASSSRSTWAHTCRPHSYRIWPGVRHMTAWRERTTQLGPRHR
jgi:hypothetical protein